MEEELKIEVMKLEIKKKIEEKKDITVNREKSIQIKHTKPAIEKIEGTSLKWFRFWNLFETKIDRMEMSARTKLFHLK